MTTKAWVKYDEISSNEGNFIIQPLDKGLGVTLGNSLRRVLLSSLEGHGIQGVKIEGITHEFATIPNVVEDVLEIICNLKGIIFKKDTEEEEVVSIHPFHQNLMFEMEVLRGLHVVQGDLKQLSQVEIPHWFYFPFPLGI